MKITKTIDFYVNEEPILAGLREDCLADYQNGDADRENLEDYVRDWLCERNYDLAEFADGLGGEEWFEENAVQPIVDMFLASLEK